MHFWQILSSIIYVYSDRVYHFTNQGQFYINGWTKSQPIKGDITWIRSIRWRHNERDGVSNHQPRDCLLKSLFRRRSKETSKLCVTGLCAGNSHWWQVNSPHKGTVTRRRLPFDDVIMDPPSLDATLPTTDRKEVTINFSEILDIYFEFTCVIIFTKLHLGNAFTQALS